MYYAGSAGYDAPRVLFPSGVARPRIRCIMADMDQKDSTLRALVVIPGSGMCTAGFTGYAAPRAVSFVVVRPRCSASWPVWTSLTVTQWAGFSCHVAPRAVFSSLVHEPMMLRIMAGMLKIDSCLRRTGKLDYWENT